MPIVINLTLQLRKEIDSVSFSIYLHNACIRYCIIDHAFYSGYRKADWDKLVD